MAMRKPIVSIQRGGRPIDPDSSLSFRHVVTASEPDQAAEQVVAALKSALPA